MRHINKFDKFSKAKIELRIGESQWEILSLQIKLIHF